MKEITKERTHVEKYTAYEAVDGTEFTSKDECIKYEDSALGVARGRLQLLFVSTNNDAWTLMGGCDDHKVIAVKFKDAIDVDTFLQWLYIECPWYLNDTHKECKAVTESIVNTAYDRGDVILIGNCDNNYYFINSRQNIIDNLMSLDKKKEEEK